MKSAELIKKLNSDPHQTLLARAENDNPDKAIACVLDNHDLHLELHKNIVGLENHIAEHEELKNSPTYNLLKDVVND